ncbi:unnamed protein product, partial [Lymnaea stagnalis]
MDASGRQQFPGQQFPSQHYPGQHFPVHQSYTWPKRYTRPHPPPSGLPQYYPFTYSQYLPQHVLASHPSLPNYGPASLNLPHAYTSLGRYPGYHSIPRLDHSPGAYSEPFRSGRITSPFGGERAILTGDFYSNAVEDAPKPT